MEKRSNRSSSGGIFYILCVIQEMEMEMEMEIELHVHVEGAVGRKGREGTPPIAVNSTILSRTATSRRPRGLYGGVSSSSFGYKYVGYYLYSVPLPSRVEYRIRDIANPM